MGLVKLFSDSKTPNNPLPNPNPFKYAIVSLVERNRNLIAVIFYPDCTTHKGLKLLVYKNINSEIFKHRSKILGCDPHFLDNDLSPFARFVPTKDGFNAALLLCDSLTEGNE